MKIKDILAKGQPTLSFEVFPPKEESNFASVEKAALEIAKLNPSFMSVTYGAGGGTSQYTVQIASDIQSTCQVPALSHLTCVSSTRKKVHSVLREIQAHGIENVLALRGDTHLGGDDFDERIVEWAVAEFRRSDRIDLTKDPAAMGRLKEEAEKAKKELSSALSAQLNLPFIAVGKDGPHHLDLSLGRPQFEMMTGDLLARTVQPVQNALRDAGISASQLGKVLLVGGSTRMPAVERQVRELLGCEPSHTLNPDECVAMGAAVQGGLLQGGGKLAGYFLKRYGQKEK